MITFNEIKTEDGVKRYAVYVGGEFIAIFSGKIEMRREKPFQMHYTSVTINGTFTFASFTPDVNDAKNFNIEIKNSKEGKCITKSKNF